MKIKGFAFSAVKAGVRYPDRLDLGLIHSNAPCIAAGVFTTNLVKAAPVIIDMQRLQKGYCQTVLVNSGCANACTGEAGLEAALVTSRLVSERLGIDDGMVQLSSTGVIGEQLNVAAFAEHADELVEELSEDNFVDVAKAIMTTDTVHKIAETTVTMSGREIRILGMAKGAGMIMPNMATMLAFVITDAHISGDALQNTLRAANDRTFNRITVDGDTSTNDMVLVMANGAAENDKIESNNPQSIDAFQQSLEVVLKDLALQIVSDGEGASKTITIRVEGAETEKDAEKIGRTIANSALVKTAFFGEDANWGRILGAMGRAGVEFVPENVKLYFGDILLVKDGLGLGQEAEQEATEVLKANEILLRVDLGTGSASTELYTCDFSIDYVKINSDYRS